MGWAARRGGGGNVTYYYADALGSSLLQLHIDWAGGDLSNGLIGYGTGKASYADSILNCVQKLQNGDVQGAIGAAQGH